MNIYKGKYWDKKVKNNEDLDSIVKNYYKYNEGE